MSKNTKTVKPNSRAKSKKNRDELVDQASPDQVKPKAVQINPFECLPDIWKIQDITTRRKRLSKLFGYEDTTCLSQSALEVDELYRLFSYTLQNNYTPGLTATLYAIVVQIRTHMREQPDATLQDVFCLFHALLMSHTEAADATIVHTSTKSPDTQGSTTPATTTTSTPPIQERFTTQQAHDITDFITSIYFDHFEAYMTLSDPSFQLMTTQFIQPLYIPQIIPNTYGLHHAQEIDDGVELDIEADKFKFEASFLRNKTDKTLVGYAEPMDPDVLQILYDHLTAVKQSSTSMLNEVNASYKAKIDALMEAKQEAEQALLTKGNRRPISSNKR